MLAKLRVLGFLDQPAEYLQLVLARRSQLECELLPDS
jgi:hypothetical protein